MAKEYPTGGLLMAKAKAVLTVLVLMSITATITQARAIVEDYAIPPGYKPVAMDESLRIGKVHAVNPGKLRTSHSDEIIHMQRLNEDLLQTNAHLRQHQDSIQPVDQQKGDETTTKPNFEVPEHKFQILEVKDSNRVNVSENLFNLPSDTSTTLTKMITSNDKPTFVHRNAVKPEISTDKDGKVLASYNILVPIWIPSIKRTNKLTMRKTDEKTEPIKFETTTNTKMLSISKSVPQLKEIIKAEKIPQSIVTDFVESPSDTLPTHPDDKIEQDEVVIKRTITNID